KKDGVSAGEWRGTLGDWLAANVRGMSGDDVWRVEEALRRRGRFHSVGRGLHKGRVVTVEIASRANPDDRPRRDDVVVLKSGARGSFDFSPPPRLDKSGRW